jgi:hypothetical protein
MSVYEKTLFRTGVVVHFWAVVMFTTGSEFNPAAAVVTVPVQFTVTVAGLKAVSAFLLFVHVVSVVLGVRVSALFQMTRPAMLLGAIEPPDMCAGLIL